MELDKHIEQLLEKYFEAGTTAAEEATLRDYFTQDQIAPHLEAYKPMFNYFSLAKEEQYTKKVPLVVKRTVRFRWVSIAAAVAMTFGVYFGVDAYQDYQEQKQARIAYEQTKEALSLLAENFGKGTEKVRYLQEFETAKQKIYKN